MNLYQIGTEYQKLLSQLYNPETGEVDTEIDAQLNALSPTAEEKCLAVAKWIKHIESEKKQIEFMKEELLRREAVFDKEIEQKFNYLKMNMERCKIDKITCPYFTIRIKTNPWSTDILDESQIPENFMRTKEIVKTERKPDKNAIKEEVLKTGVQIPGASVQQKRKLEILTDKI